MPQDRSLTPASPRRARLPLVAPEVEAKRCGFCGKMSERVVAGPEAFICAGCVHRLQATGVSSDTRGVQCAWCGESASGDRVVYLGLRRMEARGLSLATAALSGPAGQMAICGGCLAQARDIVP